MTLATILVCSSIVTGCGTSNTTVDNKQTSVEETYDIREYKCDYKTASLKTAIELNIDGQDVIIQGNLFTIVEDPLTMSDSAGNILAYADDSFKLISEDDHAIAVDGEIECILKGNIDLIGKSYNIYNAEGEQIATFKRNTLTTFDARLTDVDDNLIAEYNRGFFRNDFTIKVYDNEKLSDKAIVMIMSSFVSDQKYEG